VLVMLYKSQCEARAEETFTYI